MNDFIVNFLRDRDSYILPRALYSEGLLRCLVTDIYYDERSWKRLLPRSLHSHFTSGLPVDKTRDCLLAAAIQLIGKRVPAGLVDSDLLADRELGRFTAGIWRKNRCNLMLYSGYALEAFVAATSSRVERGLFVYHPHHKLIRHILEADAERFPEAAKGLSLDREINSSRRNARSDGELELATMAIAASSFTARSLSYAGYSIPVSVVPYGLAVVRHVAPRPAQECRFLFVGQAVQRKGIHHLFRAWKAAGLKSSSLICVCATGNQELLQKAPDGVDIKGKLSASDLDETMNRSDVLVMPSLVEGFGLVYLEAVTRGNFLIYTPNTGVPDLDLGDDAGICVPIGDIEKLTEALISAERLKLAGRIKPREIADQAVRVNFERFASGIKAALSRRSTDT